METVVTRLQAGQDLFLEIKAIVRANEIKAGVVLSAVGSLSESNIRLPVIDGKEKYANLKDLEIDNVHGTVSVNGCHLHITVSDKDGIVHGGHLKEGCIIRTTCELVIGILKDKEFVRQQDPETGFKELIA